MKRLTLLLTIFLAVPLPAESPLESLYVAQDYEQVIRQGATASPDAVEDRVYYLFALSRVSTGETAVDGARALAKAHPENAWSWYAVAGLLSDDPKTFDEAQRASVKMMKLAGAKALPQFYIVRASILRDADKKVEADKLIDQAMDRFPNNPRLLATRARQLKLDEALKLYEDARKADPNYADAYSAPGGWLQRSRRSAEAYVLLKQGIAVAPFSMAMHRGSWSAIRGLPNLSEEKKLEEIEADMQSLLRARPNSPQILFNIERAYNEMKLDPKAKEYRERLLREFPDSLETEWLVFGMGSRFSSESGPKMFADEAKVAQYRKLERDFIAWPHHQMPTLLGDAYSSLFFTMRWDTKTSDDELLEVIEGLRKYQEDAPRNVYVDIPVALADRKLHLDEAEKLARRAGAEVLRPLEKDRASYDSKEDYEKAHARAEAETRDALGWVLLQQGKLAAGLKELQAAYEINHESTIINYHLGRYYEARGNIEKAEESYTRGTLLPNAFHNDNPEALKALYVKRKGSDAGYDVYRANLEKSDADRRRKKVLEARLGKPKKVEPFKLKSLDGSTVALADLKGKVSVINFWGVWCGWCVREMPEFQTLASKYEKDPTVRVLTIDSDTDPEKVRRWIGEKKYTFPVLLDDGWLQKVGMIAYPTTWFLDPEGRIAFEKQGWSEKLVEEFSWRIEALKPAAP